MSANPQPAERRKNPRSDMSDAQFRDFTMTSLEEGKKQFRAIDGQLGTLTGHVQTLTGHVETMAAALAENTALTRKTAELAETTAADTADLVSLSKFAKSSGHAVKVGTVGASKTLRVLWPLFVAGAILAAWWHGDPVHLKEIIEAMK